MTNRHSPETDLGCWLYASECVLPATWATKAVEDIVAKSIPRNASLEVTGALLFTGTRFVQFLEGPVEAVATIQNSILGDTRHRGIATFMSGQRAERIFNDWSLAYAGPSLFVAEKVDNMLRDHIRDTSEIIALLEEFVTSKAGSS